MGPHSVLFPRAEIAVFRPTTYFSITPTVYSSPLGPNRFLPFSLLAFTSFFISLQFYCRFLLPFPPWFPVHCSAKCARCLTKITHNIIYLNCSADIKTGFGLQPASCWMCPGSSFPSRKVGRVQGWPPVQFSGQVKNEWVVIYLHSPINHSMACTGTTSFFLTLTVCLVKGQC